MNLRIAATVMAVTLWTIARLPNISTPIHSAQPSSAVGHPVGSSLSASLSTGWEVKYLRPRASRPECPQPEFLVDFDTTRKSLALHRTEQSSSSGQILVMTDEQEDDSLYIIYWRATARANRPPNCEYFVEAIGP